MPKVSAEPILIGCELFAVRGGKMLLGLRGKACFGAGTWALPGGHLEYGERLDEAMCREIKEELGATVSAGDLRLVSVVDDFQPMNDLHYVHASFELKEPAWEPQIGEADSCEEWRYFPINGLPSNIFEPHKKIIANYLSKKLYAV